MKSTNKNAVIRIPILGFRVGKCLDTVKKFKQADIKFLNKVSYKKEPAMCHHAPLILQQFLSIASHQTLN